MASSSWREIPNEMNEGDEIRESKSRPPGRHGDKRVGSR
jgi:hypothetical protein